MNATLNRRRITTEEKIPRVELQHPDVQGLSHTVQECATAKAKYWPSQKHQKSVHDATFREREREGI